MTCPRCSKPMTVRKMQDAEVDFCEGCSGLFLDHGELNEVARGTDGDLEYSTVQLESFRHEDRHGSTICPRCPDREMKKVEFNIYTRIILDYCSECRGFWLDGDELERINNEVRKLDRPSEGSGEPPMMWFARFIWALPR